MSIFIVNGMDGQIRTTQLPSGDMAVAGPGSGPLEQIIFDICRWDGRRNPAYGGWIIPREYASRAYNKLLDRCIRISE
jgi:hypothetical protein